MSTSSDSSCPRVWSRFQARKRDGTVLKMRIQEAPSSIFDQVTDFMIKYFITGENIQKVTGVASNAAALAEYHDVLKYIGKTWSIFICCEDNASEIVMKILGVSSVHLLRKEDPPLNEFQTKEMQKLYEILMGLEKLYKPSFDICHEGRGITVHPEYRGLGIATEFVKVRRLVINEQNIPMTCAWMTSYGSQKAADKDKWETMYEITSEEFAKRYGVVLEDAPLTFKFMLATNSNKS